MGNFGYPSPDTLHRSGFVMVFVPALRKRLPALKKYQNKAHPMQSSKQQGFNLY